MKLTTIVAVSLTMSVAILSAIMLGVFPSTLNKPQISDSVPNENMQNAVMIPQEPQKIVLVPKESNKENAVIQQPEPGRLVEPPKQEIVMKPPQPIQIQPPQQVVQAPQAALPEVNIREGVPQNFVMKGATVTVMRTIGVQGENAIRQNLTNEMLVNFALFKQSLIDVNATTAAWIKMCAPAYLAIDCANRPSMMLRMNEQELISFTQLVNLPASYNEPNRFENRIFREYGSVVVYGGVRYLLTIGVFWES